VIRNALAVVVGLATGVLLIMGVQKIGHTIYPPPAGLDFNDAEAARTYISQLPLPALLFPIVSYFLGTLFGGFVACTVGTARPGALAGIIGLILLAFTIANLILIPHPLWFSLLAIGVVLAGTWLAIQVAPIRSAD
jgi:hypothetical protein